eukprot:m.141785 g.141785  ORF g.141785 m.141785 type:complete len:283 (+) comp16139_c0_seq1:142-990(+)
MNRSASFTYLRFLHVVLLLLMGTMASRVNVNDEPSSLKLMTFNVWFAEDGIARRSQRLFEIINEHKPDVVALQEVTAAFLFFLKEDSDLLSTMTLLVEPSLEARRKSYGVALLVAKHHKVVRTLEHVFPTSSQGRGVWAVQLPSLWLATMHFESPVPGNTNGPARQRQLETAQRLLQQHLETSGVKTAIMMGDFNAVSDDEANWLAPDWVDLWLQLRPGEAGYTYDKNTNPYVKKYATRIDKVVMYGETYASTSIERVGMPEEGKVTASDHYGLLACLQSNN